MPQRCILAMTARCILVSAVMKWRYLRYCVLEAAIKIVADVGIRLRSEHSRVFEASSSCTPSDIISWEAHEGIDNSCLIIINPSVMGEIGDPVPQS